MKLTEDEWRYRATVHNVPRVKMVLVCEEWLIDEGVQSYAVVRDGEFNAWADSFFVVPEWLADRYIKARHELAEIERQLDEHCKQTGHSKRFTRWYDQAPGDGAGNPSA